MITITLTPLEKEALLYVTAPSTYKRLYLKADELEKADVELQSYLTKKNYSMVTELYNKKIYIKQNIAKNQLTLLRLYQAIITASVSNDKKNYILTINNNLVPLLVESISYVSNSIRTRISKNKASEFEQKIEPIYTNILQKIEDEIDGYELFRLNKILSSKKDVIEFSEFLDRKEI